MHLVSQAIDRKRLTVEEGMVEVEKEKFKLDAAKLKDLPHQRAHDLEMKKLDVQHRSDGIGDWRGNGRGSSVWTTWAMAILAWLRSQAARSFNKQAGAWLASALGIVLVWLAGLGVNHSLLDQASGKVNRVGRAMKSYAAK